ncbi:hypothetical protein GCM10022631_12180 [Deinococcus rubellus]|uniref:DUF3800 domain-containing protein n=1 Tax=Deinococcus rubellus TaxID=1889240 RepID=A0ABY5YEZ3_9DEIO|nr:hypothetical protein [Deinococcus rubellus]UWX62736.1 hypothetical protein N0D28_08115 [Deinococcus rubellus]
MAKTREEKNYTFAFDDSGGIEPFLNPDKTFREGQFPFLIIAAIGLRNDLLEKFYDEWNLLRGDIKAALDLSHLPPLHARLMFGASRPETYRKMPNPYLNVDQALTQEWFIRAFDILNALSKVKGGAGGLSAIYRRESYKSSVTYGFQTELSTKESSFIKLNTKGKKKSYHQKYLSAASSVLIRPVFDCFGMIQEIMRQIDGEAQVFLDPFSSSDGLNDEIVFDFIRQHLALPKISSVRRVEDTDNEPLSQAADLIAYGHFRDELIQVRLKNGQNPPFEPMLEAARIRWGPPRICSADVGHIWRRKRSDRRYDQISVAAMYSTAFYELQKFHPDFTNQYLVTPDEFLNRVIKILGNTKAGYIPILKDGVLEAWEAINTISPQKGEDRP